jgi:hypothetical protein
MSLFIFIASLLFAAGGCVQLFRYFKQIKVELGTFEVPVWASGVVGVIFWLLAIWGFILL